MRRRRKKKGQGKGEDREGRFLEARAVGSYGDWKVYHSASGKAKICYLLAEPKTREPGEEKSDKAYAFISERPAERVRNEVSFVMGFEVATAADLKERKHDKKAKVETTAAPTVVIGDAEFDLAPKGSDLWVKNAAEESKVIDEMRKGSSLVIKADDEAGPRHDRHLFADRLQPGGRQGAEGLPELSRRTAF